MLNRIPTASLKQGWLFAGVSRPGFVLKPEASTECVIKNSKIEGEVLERDSVRSSLARRLGFPPVANALVD